MKSNRRKKKKDLKAAEVRLIEVLRAIEKAALGDEGLTCVTDLAEDEEGHKQIQAPDDPTRRRN
jgi:hypothetical protein